tara:strand:+ start:2291 stop:2695 length:405 start_codon:yes stop_codon:yes gene_type:complete
MPVYKALILNKEISVNYEENQKDKLIEAIDQINNKLKEYDNLSGKISDNKLLSFVAIKLQAELLDFEEKKIKDSFLEKKMNDSNSENIALNDKLYRLNQENEILKKENDLINQELNKIEKQINVIINLIKKTYE